jgi:ADP-ribose pyrophosphatase
VTRFASTSAARGLAFTHPRVRLISRAVSDAPDPSNVKRGFAVRAVTERVRLPNGHWIELDIVKHPGAAAVVPVLASGDVVLIHQYRHATGGMLYEVPAGKLEPGEDPAHCAARELQEEAGQRAGRMLSLGWIWTTPGFTDERVHLFAALDLSPVPQQLQADEVIETLSVPFARALDWIWSGRIQDAKSALALLHAARALGNLG